MLFERKSQIKFGLSFIGLFVGAFVSMSAFAAKESNLVGEEMKRQWGVTESKQKVGCEHTLTTGCIGDSLSNCAVWTNDTVGDVSNNYGTAKDEGTIIMMVATEIATHGAKFCPTQIQAANRDRTFHTTVLGITWYNQNSKSWTEYYFKNGSESPSSCIWLCKDGYQGTGCNTTSTSVCSGSMLSKSNYSNVKRVTTGTNVEDEIPMFYMNKYDDYNYGDADDGSEYDTILGITRFLDSGNGAFAAPISVRAYRHGEEGKRAWLGGHPELNVTSTPYLAVAGTEKLVCKNGYKPNSNNTDCVLATPEMCAEKKANQTACSGFSGYDSKSHIKDVKVDQGCYEFHCAGGKAFESATSRKCIECTGEPGRFGVVEETGVCVKCSSGTVFDRKDKSSGYCPKAVSYSPTVLEYGKNGSSGDSISNQCWTFTDLDLYKECVENGATKAKAKLQQKRADADASRAAQRARR